MSSQREQSRDLYKKQVRFHHMVRIIKRIFKNWVDRIGGWRRRREWGMWGTRKKRVHRRSKEDYWVCENDSLRCLQSTLASNSLRNASQQFLSITPSSAFVLANTVIEEGQKRTVSVRICYNDISCTELDEKLLHKFQWGVDIDSQGSLRDYAERSSLLEALCVGLTLSI